MKRRCLFAVVGCVFVLSACGSAGSEPAAPEAVEVTTENEDVKVEEPVKEESVKEERAVEVATSEDTASETAKEEVSEPNLADLEAFLLDKGVLLGDRVQKMGSMVGAIDGFGYDNCEIYFYDTGSEAYQKVENGEEIFIEGMESLGGIKFDAVNGSFVLFLKGSDSGLVEAFNSFK